MLESKSKNIIGMLGRKKGFTLIELLAVIVVLAIIMVIAVPLVLNAIEDAKKGAFKSTAYGILKTVDYQHAISTPVEGGVTYHYEGDNEWSIPEGYKLNFKGSKPEYGKIVVDSHGKISLALHSGKWCAVKDFDEEEVKVYEASVEECLDRTTQVTIELIGEETEYVEINTNYTDPGVIAKNKDGEIIEEVKVEIRFEDNVVENIDVSKLGTYKIIYTAEYMEYKAIASRTVVVRDTIPPVLTIPSNVTLSVEELSSYDFMDGVSVYDNSLEEIEVIMSGNVVAYPGEYTITYKAEDSSGNKVEKERYITVIDIGYPEITIIGDNPVNINVGDEYVDSGATAIDDVDGDITDQIIVTGTVNPNIPGTYTITYRVTDSSGNETVATRTVHVIDNIPPTIVFETNGNSTYAKSRSTTVTVTDAHGIVTGRYYQWSTSTTTPSSSSFTQTFSNGASISTPSGATGGYYLWIKAVDNSGNEKITRSNVFNLDNTGPNITSVSIDATNVTENSFVITRSGNASDEHSGLADNPYKYQISTNGSSWTTKCTSDSTTCNVTGLSADTTYYYRLCVNDVLSNESCTSSKIVKTLTGDFDVAKGVNKPILTSGMTPIKWNGTTEVTTTANDLDWYDYGEKRWANAKTKDGSYWVWIPRYGYKITSCFHSNCSGGAGNIEIKFLIGTSNVASDGTIVETSGYNFGVKDTSTHYFLHPAFTFGNEEITGFWVAKFEPSGSADDISIKPNATSLRDMKIGDQFDAAYNMRYKSKYGWSSSEVDTHMMKNTEWGAVAYLSQSEYGANKEIWINNSEEYITGCAGNSVSALYVSGCQNAYNTATGQKASTTHNIYGVYDMSGGAWERVAAYVDNGSSNLTKYGQSIINADIKYKDVYIVGSSDWPANNYEANKNKYGDAVYETSSSGDDSSGWNSDYSYMPYSSVHWFYRGGMYNYGTAAGAFNFFHSGSGVAYSYYSFRPVVVPAP